MERTDNSMRIVINAMVVALEELAEEGRRILADDDHRDEMTEQVKTILAAIDESLPPLRSYLDTGDVSDLQTVIRVMSAAQSIIGNPFGDNP